MESIFENETEGVGSDIEAYCPSPRCKADTNHTVISKYEDEIRRVQCVVCGDVHAYRKPRGEANEEPPEPTPKKTRKKLSWEQFMARTTAKDMENCRPYSIRDTYEEGDMVSHPTFHVGFVSDLLPDNKVEITFRDERRVLVHNRADLANKMPAVAELPVPRADKKKRRKKRQASGASDPLLPQIIGKELPESLEEKEAVAEQAARLKLASEREKIEKKLEAERTRAIEERKKEEERKKLEAERERERIRKEKEKERLRKEKEKERIRKEKQREKERLRKIRDRERLRKEREREQERKRKEREKLKVQKEKEKERARKEKEKERARKAKEKERARKEKERARKAKQKAPARRTGGKKTVPSIRRTGGKKSVPAAAARNKKPKKKRRR